MRVRIKVRPTGLLNGREWPEVGQDIEVPDAVGADLCGSGTAEPVVVKKVEKRPAPKRGETRKG